MLNKDVIITEELNIKDILLVSQKWCERTNTVGIYSKMGKNRLKNSFLKKTSKI